MTDHDTIDGLLRQGIQIISKEIIKLSQLQDAAPLPKPEADKLINYLSSLVAIRKDWRASDKEQEAEAKTLSTEEYEQAILEEAEKIKAKRG